MKYFHGVDKSAESQQNPVKRHIQTRASLASEKANQERSKRGRSSAGSLCKYLADFFFSLTAASRTGWKSIFFWAERVVLWLQLAYFFVEKHNDISEHSVLEKIKLKKLPHLETQMKFCDEVTVQLALFLHYSLLVY